MHAKVSHHESDAAAATLSRGASSVVAAVVSGSKYT
jgi:hypothetical protein